MIDEDRTLSIYGYQSTDLSPQSHKPIIYICDECGAVGEARKGRVMDLCPSCVVTGERNTMFGKHLSDEAKRLISEANRGDNHWNFGKHRSAAVRKKISDNHADFRGAKSPLYGIPLSEERKRKMSKDRKGKKKMHSCTEETKEKLRINQTGRVHSDETKRKIGDANRGKKRTDEIKQKISDTFAKNGHPWTGKHHTAESNEKNRQAHTGKTLSEEHRHHISAGGLGVSYDKWDGYADPDKYCNKFNEECRESNRQKHGNECFICGKSENENGRKLAVHHVDRNKNQGCDGHEWRLVPLCGVCHPTVHSDIWESRINYVLDNA